MNILRTSAILFLSLFFVGCISMEKIEQEARRRVGQIQQAEEQVQRENERRFNAMTLASVDSCATVKDDEMSNIVTFSSEPCYEDEPSVYSDASESDFFIRAHKSKNSGGTSYQVYAFLLSPDWSYPYSASYLKPTPDGGRGLVKIDGEQIGSDVTNCSLYGCTHYEHFTFPLQKSYLKALSDNYEALSQAGNKEKFRIFRQAGFDVDFVLNINELVGVYRKVENY